MVIARCGEFFRPSSRRSLSPSWLAILLLRSGIEAEPGPCINFGFVNAQSVVNKGALVIDLIESQCPKLDMLAVCESYVVNDDPDVIKFGCLPSGFRVVHRPRPKATRSTRGGGVCIIYRDTMTVQCHQLQRVVDQYKSFECLLVSVDVNGGNRATKDCDTVAIIYRPPSSSQVSFENFYNDLSDLLLKVGDAIDTHRFLAFGDFNCGGDEPTLIRSERTTLLNSHGLQQHVSSATRTTSTSSSLLDLVINSTGSKRVSHVEVKPTHRVSDHDLVTGAIETRTRPMRHVHSYRFRSLKSVNWDQFRSDVNNSALFIAPADTADAFADQIDFVVTSILDKQCPVQTRSKFLSARRDNRWLSADAVQAKRQRRRLERQWRSSRNNDCYIAYRKACRTTNKTITESRRTYYMDKIISSESEPRRRWAAIRDVLHMTESTEQMNPDDCQRLCDGFADYFAHKIRNIKIAIESRLANLFDQADATDPLQYDVRHTGHLLSDLQNGVQIRNRAVIGEIVLVEPLLL